MKRILFALTPLVLAAAASIAQAQHAYDWTGGASGYAGVIVLDTSSNDHGSISDILSASVITPDGTFAFDPTTAYQVQDPFSWDASGITSMWINWVGPANVNLGFGQDISFTGENFVGSNGNVDISGSWSAAPDGASTACLLVFGTVALLALPRTLRRPTVA